MLGLLVTMVTGVLVNRIDAGLVELWKRRFDPTVQEAVYRAFVQAQLVILEGMLADPHCIDRGWIEAHTESLQRARTRYTTLSPLPRDLEPLLGDWPELASMAYPDEGVLRRISTTAGQRIVNLARFHAGIAAPIAYLERLDQFLPEAMTRALREELKHESVAMAFGQEAQVVIYGAIAEVSERVAQVRAVQDRNHREQMELLKEIHRALANQDKPYSAESAVEEGPLDQPPKRPRLVMLFQSPLRSPFVGRTDLMASMRAHFDGPKRDAPLVLHGQPGVGKSRAAYEYAKARADDYHDILWFTAERETDLRAQMTETARTLGLVQNDDLAQGVDRLRSWLTEQSHWLVVLDNAHIDLQEFVPSGGLGDVLITARSPFWPLTYASVRLEPLRTVDAAEFLMERTNQHDVSAALQIANQLGGLPLALEQASIVMHEHNWSFSTYMSQWQVAERELSAVRPQEIAMQQNLANVLSLSLARVEQRHPLARPLLELLAFMAPQGIDPILLAPDAFESQDNATPVDIASARLALEELSLVQRREDGYTIHRLVQEYVRLMMTQEQRTSTAQRVLDRIASCWQFDPADSQSWTSCANLLPHGRVILEWLHNSDALSHRAVRMAESIGTLLRHIGQDREGSVWLERAFEWSKVQETEDDGSLLDSWAVSLAALGDTSSAKKMLELALQAKEAHYGPYHPEVAKTLTNLAIQVSTLGDAHLAKTLLEQALTLLQSIHGPDHPEVAKTLTNLAIQLGELGDVQGAKTQLERALRIKEGFYGPEHPEIAATITNLAVQLGELGDARGAKALLERALRITESFYGPDHPEVAITLNNLANQLGRLGDAHGAKTLLERVHKIEEAFFGPQHPEVAKTLTNLAIRLGDLGDARGAKDLLERALQILEPVYGLDHPHVATTLKNLATQLGRLGDTRNAEALLQQALIIEESFYGMDHPEVAITLHNLANRLEDLGDQQAAKELRERSYAIFKRSYGPDHPHTRLSRRLLLETLSELGDEAGMRRLLADEDPDPEGEATSI